MPDLFSQAALFYPKIADNASPQRAELIQELEKILNSSAFLREEDKAKMRKVIPIFSDSVIEDLKQSLIRQNLRYLQGKIPQNK